MLTYILLHDAMYGGWCWQAVKKKLQQLGHAVYTPTFTGMGERSHLLSPLLNHKNYTADIANLIKYEGIGEFILVAPGYSTLVASCIAATFPKQVQHLVYLNAPMVRSGETYFSLHEPSFSADLVSLAKEKGDGCFITPELTMLPAWGWESIAQRSEVFNKLTPVALAGYTTPVFFDEAALKAVSYTLIEAEWVCAGENMTLSLRARRDRNLFSSLAELKASAVPMITHSTQLLTLLLDLPVSSLDKYRVTG